MVVLALARESVTSRHPNSHPRIKIFSVSRTTKEERLRLRHYLAQRIKRIDVTFNATVLTPINHKFFAQQISKTLWLRKTSSETSEESNSLAEDGLSFMWVLGSRFFPRQGQKFSATGVPARACCAAIGWLWAGKLPRSLQSSQALVHQAEESLERISRTQFDVDTPDADGQTSRNLKESQTNLTDRGHGQLGPP